ncbi:MAG: type II secretion system protein [Mariprofundaceae bacterium]|nr:type II secretion system protein [Mariprofundaceae bacterium]
MNNYACCDPRESRSGFTLVELLIVVSIIGLLATLALPAFSSFRSRAYDTSALSHSHTMITFEDGYFVDHMNYVVLPPVIGSPVPPHPMARYGAPAQVGFQLGVPKPGTLVCYVGHAHGSRYFAVSRTAGTLTMFRKVANPALAATSAPVDKLLDNQWGPPVQ